MTAGVTADRTPGAAPRPPRRLRRWLLRLFLLAIVLRIALAFALPWLVERALGLAGCTGTCAAASLSIGGASVHIHGLQLRDASRPDGVAATVQEVIADLSTWQLLQGNLALSNLLLSGPHIDVTTRPDGSLVLPATAAAATPPATDGAAPAPAAPATWSFVPPFAVATARLHDARLRVLGPDGKTPLQTYLLDAALLDLGRHDVPCTFDLRFANPARVDTLHLAGTLSTTADHASLRWNLVVHGLAARPLLGDGVVGDEPLALDASGSWDARRGGSGEIALQAEFELRSPALADDLAVAAHGELRPDGSATLAVDANLHRLALRAFAPLLDGLGLRLPPDGLDARAALAVRRDGDGRLAATLAGLELAGGGETLALNRVELTGLARHDHGLAAARLAIDGPVAAIQRGADGAFVCCGASWRPVDPARGAATAVPAPAPAAPPFLTLGELDCRGIRVQYTEAHADGPRSLLVDGASLTGAGLELRGARLLGSAALDLPLPDVVRNVHVEVRGKPHPDGVAADIALQLDGIALRRLTPWLTPRGIRSTFADGVLRADCEVRAALGDMPQLDLRLANVRLADGDTVWLGLRNAEIRGLGAGDGGVTWRSCEIDDPLVLVDHGAEGMTIAGLHFALPAAAADHAEPPAPTSPTAPTAGPVTLRLPARTGPLALRGATLRLLGPEPTAIGIDGSLGAFTAGAAVPFELAVRMDQQVDRVQVAGTIAPTAHDVVLDATLRGEGLRGRAVTAWLPTSVTCTLTDGALGGHLQAKVAFAEADATAAADLSIDGLVLRDRGTELAAIDHLAVRAPTLGAGLVHLASVRIEGVRAAVAATDQGLVVPGFRLAPAPAPAAATPGGTAAPTPRAAPGRLALPALRIDELVLALERLDYRDRRAGEAAPLTAAVRAELTAPWATAAELEASPPLQLRLQGHAAPVVAEITGSIDLLPFRLRPELGARVTLSGIDTTALPTVLPALAGTLRGSERHAELRFAAHAELDLHRTEPTHFPFARAFGLVAEVTDLAMVGDDGENLAAIPDLVLQADAIDPRTGDVFVRSIEVEAPTFAARREADGLHALGLVLALPAATATITPPPAAPARTAGDAGATAPEFAVGRLVVRGLAADFRDAETTPPTHLPIAELDLTVRGFTTRASSEPRPIAFALQLRGGDVELERRIVHSSLIAGMLGSTGRLIAGQDDAHEPEARPLVETVSARGDLLLFPRPKGSVRASVRGFELPALRGLARPSGVAIADGVFDGSVAVELRPTATRVKSLLQFRWLSITEPPGGPISTYLRLPAPLDTVLFVLRNADGEQRLPLQFEAPATGDPSTAVVQAAVEALTLLIADAIGGTPTRVLTTLTHALGLGGTDDLGDRALAIGFDAGSATADQAPAMALAAGLGADPEVHFVLAHELGSDDVPVVGRRANPSPEVVQATVAHLRAAIADAEVRRAALLPEVAARFLAGQTQAAEALRQDLRAQDDAIGAMQATLTTALAQRTETDERKRARRTRDGLLELGELRLAACREALLQQLGPDGTARVEVQAVRGRPAAELANGRVVVTPVRRRG